MITHFCSVIYDLVGFLTVCCKLLHLFLRIELDKDDIQNRCCQRNKETNGIDTDQNGFRFLSDRICDVTSCCQNTCKNRIGDCSSTFVGKSTNCGDRTVQLITGCFLYIICHSKYSHRTECICHSGEHTCNKCQDI